MVLIAVLRTESLAKGLVATVPLNVPSKAEAGGRRRVPVVEVRLGVARLLLTIGQAPRAPPRSALCNSVLGLFLTGTQ